MGINQPTKSVLQNIRFIERYRELSRNYSFDYKETFSPPTASSQLVAPQLHYPPPAHRLPPISGTPVPLTAARLPTTAN
jgi:hypothetical protein